MSRFTTTFAIIALSVGCKKQVEVGDLPGSGYDQPAAVAPMPSAEAAVRMASNFQRVNFEFDSSALNESSKTALAANAKIMMDHPSLGLVVQGHCDERGTTDYNLALGDLRAQAVASYLKASGIAGSRLQTISLGEEVPLEAESGEHAWSKNRRAEFVVVGAGEEGVKGTATR